MTCVVSHVPIGERIIQNGLEMTQWEPISCDESMIYVSSPKSLKLSLASRGIFFWILEVRLDESTVLVLVNCVSRVETSFRRRRRRWIFVFLFFFVAVVLICTALLERTHEIMEVLWWWFIFPLLRSFRWSMNVPVRRQRIYFIHDTTFRWKMCRTRVRSRILQQPARIWDARGCNLKSRNEVIYAMYICIHGRVGWCWYGLMRGYMVR